MKCLLDSTHLRQFQKELLIMYFFYNNEAAQSRFTKLFSSDCNTSFESKTTQPSIESNSPKIDSKSLHNEDQDQEEIAENLPLIGINDKSLQKQLTVTHDIDISKILLNEDTRTSIMIKNIPNKLTLAFFSDILNKSFKGTYDLFLLPTDKKEKKNFGYAFINFAHSYHIINFFQYFQGRLWENTNSVKICKVVYSKHQGLKKILRYNQNQSKHCNIQVEERNIVSDFESKRIVIPKAQIKAFLRLYPKASYTAFNDDIIVHISEFPSNK